MAVLGAVRCLSADWIKREQYWPHGPDDRTGRMLSRALPSIFLPFKPESLDRSVQIDFLPPDSDQKAFAKTPLGIASDKYEEPAPDLAVLSKVCR